MDRDRFDALTRLLATTGSRRAALGALLGAGLLARTPVVLAKPGKNRKRRKKRGHKARGGQEPGPAPEPCCGTKHCAPPEPGSTRSQCNYAGRSFAGQEHDGSTFRRIDGRFANFDVTDNRGSIFAEACLNGATFRGAKLGGSTWGDACLLAADFTGADLGGDSATFDDALFCGTIMPDGTRNDRDCAIETGCCFGARGGAQTCGTAADCPDAACQAKFCDSPCPSCIAICSYDDGFSGPSPNGLCATVCCTGECCPSDAYVCDGSDECCLPGSPTDCDQSGACAAACGETCAICVTLANGGLQCGDLAQLSCSACRSNADCPASSPQCIASYTLRNTSVTFTAGQTCRNPALTASCATIFPC